MGTSPNYSHLMHPPAYCPSRVGENKLLPSYFGLIRGFLPISPAEQSGPSRFSFSFQPQQQKGEEKIGVGDNLVQGASDTGVLVLWQPPCTGKPNPAPSLLKFPSFSVSKH